MARGGKTSQSHQFKSVVSLTDGSTNIYPGVRCDVPSAVYQFTFESNTQWSEYYCSGGEIQHYVKRVAQKYGVYKYVKLQIEFVGATWKEEEGKWEVKLKHLPTNKVSVNRTKVQMVY